MKPLPMELVAAQHGLLTNDQLKAAGITTEDRQRFAAEDQLERLSSRVFRVTGVARTSGQKLMAAVLDVGHGVVSHSSALAWWEVAHFVPEPVHITRPGLTGRRQYRLVDHVHHTTDLPDHHVRVLDGVPVVCPERTLFDLAGQPDVDEARAARTMDSAWGQRLVSASTLQAMLTELSRRGRRGLGTMRALLNRRSPDHLPAPSNLEWRVSDILRQAGDDPVHRRPIRADDRDWLGRTDFADDRLPLRLEVRTERLHRGLPGYRTDEDRLLRLRAPGSMSSQ